MVLNTYIDTVKHSHVKKKYTINKNINRNIQMWEIKIFNSYTSFQHNWHILFQHNFTKVVIRGKNILEMRMNFMTSQTIIRNKK